jgi:ABC-type transport system involved in cytochrome c biogenesis permease subunit
MPDESALYFVANLTLFALLLLYWAHLFRPKWVAKRMLPGTLVLFLICQGMALLWSALQLGPWAFAHHYLSTMFLIETIVFVYFLSERWFRKTGVGAFVLTLALVIHTYIILLIAPPIEATLRISPFERSPWYLLHLVCALLASGAYTCAGGGATGYFVARFLTRSRFAPQLPSRQDCQVFTRRALVIGFPWLSGSLVSGAIWAHLAWGNYWSWRPEEIWLLIEWLVLTMTLHARTMPGWQGKPLALLALLGSTLALLSLAFIGQS